MELEWDWAPVLLRFGVAGAAYAVIFVAMGVSRPDNMTWLVKRLMDINGVLVAILAVLIVGY